MWADVVKMGTACLSPPNSRDLLGAFLGDLPSPNGVIDASGEEKVGGVDDQVCLLLDPESVPSCPQPMSLWGEKAGEPATGAGSGTWQPNRASRVSHLSAGTRTGAGSGTGKIDKIEKINSLSY